MKKKIFSIWSVLLILVVSIAVLVPGCDGACTGDIEVKATLCDAPWPGAVQYTLTPESGSPINGTSVNATHSGVDCGNWTCAYVSGGPPGYFVDITTSPTQEVTNGAVITFTLNFEEDQDAGIVFETWTINGVPIEDLEYGEEWWYDDPYYYALVTLCDVIDVHYTQWVDGCKERLVALNETDELLIHYAWYEGEGEPPEFVEVHVLDDWCAVTKTVEPQGPDGEKLDQVASFMGETVKYCDYEFLPWCVNMTLDVETSWELVKCLNYTKTINWLHIGSCFEGPPPPQGPSPCCVLFDLLVPGPGFGIELRSRASVELVDDEDADPKNNSTGWSPPLVLITVPMGPV